MNRPVPISVFSDQHRTKSTTWSRTSGGTHTLVRAPQDFFLKRCVRPSIRPTPRLWCGSSFLGTRSVVVHLGGPAGSCPGRRPRHSRRTLSASGRTLSAAVHAPHRDQKPALYPTSAALEWQPSLLNCSAFALFACRPLRYINGRTLSPVPAEARQFSQQSLFLACPFAVKAQDPFEIYVYEYEQLPPVRFTLKGHFNFVGIGTKSSEGTVVPTNHQFHMTGGLTGGTTFRS